MGQREKLLERIRNNPKDVAFDDLDKLLQWHGFERRNPGGSHYVYSRAGATHLTVPRARPLRSVYVRQALALLESLQESEE